MPKISRQVGTTGQVVDILAQNSSLSTGAGLTGLAYNTAGLTCYYHRNTANASVAVSLATQTLGTWATGGFIVVDGTNMPGLYQFGIPNAALVAGADTVTFYFEGATNLAPIVLEIELTATNNQSAAGGLVLAKTTNITGFNDIAATSVVTAGAITTSSGAVSSVTTVGSVTGAVGSVTGSVGSVTGAVGSVTGNVGGNVVGSTASVTGAVGSVTGAVGSVTGAVGSVTGNVGGNVVGSTASVTGAVGSVTGSVGSVVGAVGSVTGAVGSVTSAPFKVNTASGFSVFLVQSGDNKSPFTAGGVTAVRSINGGSQGAVSGTITQVGSTNEYYFSGAAADFNGATVSFVFSATGANTVYLSINTQP